MGDFSHNPTRHLPVGQIENLNDLYLHNSIIVATVSRKHPCQYRLSTDLASTPVALTMLHGDVLYASRRGQTNVVCTVTDVVAENIFRLDAKTEASDRLERLI